jgi:hypothetical protein
MKVQIHNQDTDTITDANLGELPRDAEFWCLRAVPGGRHLDSERIVRRQLGAFLRLGGVARMNHSCVPCGRLPLIRKAD